MTRIVGIEIRRSAALGVGLLVLAAGAVLLLSFMEGFAGRWTQLTGGMRTSLFAMWPLALAGGAFLGRRDARTRVGELFATTARPRWQRVAPTALAIGLTAVAGFLGMLAIGLVLVVPSATHFDVGTIGLVAAGAVSMVAAVWLGLAAGRAMPWLVTPPALAVIGVLAVGLLPDFASIDSMMQGDAPPPKAVMLSPAYVSGFDDFQAFATGPSLVQVLWFATVAVTGLMLFATTGARARALSVLPAALGLAVTLPLLPTGGYEGALRVDRAALELVCDDDGPQVCMTKVHSGLLPDVAGPVRETLALLATKLPAAPTRAVEGDTPTSYVRPGSMPDPRRYGADTLVFRAPSYTRTGGADLDASYREALLEKAWELNCGDDERRIDRNIWLARQVATAWLLGRPYGQDPELPGAFARFTAKSPDEQRSLLAAARAGVVACDTEPLLAILP